MSDTRFARTLGVSLPFLASLLLSGCGSSDIIDPQIEVPEKRSVVVMPFRDQMFANGFDSPRGGELATLVTQLLKKNGEFKVISTDRVLDLFNVVDPRLLTAKEVAKRLNADYVFMGDVKDWKTKDENMVSPVYRGSSVVDISIYETYEAACERTPKDVKDLPKGRGRLAVSGHRCLATFPHEFGMANIGTYEMTPDKVEEGLKNATAQSVSWTLVAHTKDEEKLASSK